MRPQRCWPPLASGRTRAAARWWCRVRRRSAGRCLIPIPAALDEQLAAWLAAAAVPEAGEAERARVAVDGKTMRGAIQADGRAVHLLAAMTGGGAVLAQRQVGHKTNEITQVKPLLDPLPIHGAVITLAALTWRTVPVQHVMKDRGHGRDEVRTIQVLPAPDGIFPHAAQAFLIERHVADLHGNPKSDIAALGITSMTARRGSPAVIAGPRPRPLGNREQAALRPFSGVPRAVA
jgi:hypothetical protein